MRTINQFLLLTILVFACTPKESSDKDTKTAEVQHAVGDEGANKASDETKSSYELSPNYQWKQTEMVKVISPDYGLDISASAVPDENRDNFFRFLDYKLTTYSPTTERDSVVFENSLSGSGYFFLKAGESEFTFHFKSDGAEYILFPRNQGSDDLPLMLHVIKLKDKAFNYYEMNVGYDFQSGKITDEIIQKIIEETVKFE